VKPKAKPGPKPLPAHLVRSGWIHMRTTQAIAGIAKKRGPRWVEEAILAYAGAKT
jgi:hypothetical protein